MLNVLGLSNGLAGIVYRVTRRDLRVGSGTYVNWLRLGRPRGRLEIGADSVVKCRVDFDCPSGIVRIGSRTYIGASHLVCHTLIDIGDDVIISWDVTVVDHDSHSPRWSTRSNDVANWRAGRKTWEGVSIGAVKVSNRVWIGLGATILKGVTLGEGAVIAARAVVTHDVAPYTLVAGNPARPIRTVSEDGASSVV